MQEALATARDIATSLLISTEDKYTERQGSKIVAFIDEALSQPAQEPVAHIKQGMDGYPKLVFNGKFEYESIAAKWDDIALYTKEQL